MPIATTASLCARIWRSCGSVSWLSIENSIEATGVHAVRRSLRITRRTPSSTLCSISVISRVSGVGALPLPPSSISTIGNTSEGFISRMALPSYGFIPSVIRHVGDESDCVNSRNESCSTEIKLTTTYERR